jgi:hypothetical protein
MTPRHKSRPTIGDKKELVWGRHRMPASEATGHFLAVAASGGGKSTLLQLLMQSALGEIGVAPDTRALVYDAKQEALPQLEAICPLARIITAHPYDKRGAAWDLYRDVKDPAVALEIAHTFIPPANESQPFFADASRHLLYGVIVSLILTGKPWTLATLIRIMQVSRRIRRVLRRHEVTRPIEKEYFNDAREAANIMSTVATKLLPFANIAASWETAETSFSLEDWVKGNWILVLGNYETSRSAIDAINRCIFKRATDLVLNQSNSFTRRTWFIWDELSEAGKLDGLVPIMKKGRSKGACCVLAFQSVQGLRDRALYGSEATDEVLGQIGNRFFGRLECEVTADWASRLFGDQELEEESVTESTGAGGTSRSVNRHRTTKRLVMPSEFMDLDACNQENGLSGFYIVRSHGAYFDKIEGSELWGKSLVPPCKDVPDFIPRPPMAMLLKPWTAEEESTFCVPTKRRKQAPKRRPERNESPSDEVRSFEDLDRHFQ